LPLNRPQLKFYFSWGLFYNILLYLARNPVKKPSIPLKLAYFCLHVKFYKVKMNYFYNCSSFVNLKGSTILQHFAYCPPVHYILLIELYICRNIGLRLRYAMAIVFLMNEEIARGMVCFFHQKKHSYLILWGKSTWIILSLICRCVVKNK
jgi:hypothetical protein